MTSIEASKMTALALLRRRRSAWGTLALFAGVVGIWAWWGWSGADLLVVHWRGIAPAQHLEHLGQAGDLFGGVSALFSALAFAGVAVAAFLQREQLVGARRGAAEAAIAASATKAAADAQYARQAFEPLFFKLIELLRARSGQSQLLVRSPPGAQPGLLLPPRLSFDAALVGLREQVSTQFGVVIAPDTPSGWVDRLTDVYTRFYRLNESQLGPYFRTLFQLFKLVYTSAIAEADKVQYANIVRGLLSRDELLLLMLNCCSEYGQKMKVFVNLFGLLKHVSMQDNRSTHADQKLALECFEPTATMSHLRRLEYWRANGGKPALVDD